MEPHGASAGREPEAEPVAAIGARRASLPEHLGECLLTHDRAREERAPERRHVRGGRVDAAVAASDDGQVEDVRPPRRPRPPRTRAPRARGARPSGGRPCRPSPRACRRGRGRGRGTACRHPLRDQGEHDVAAVAVGEALAGRELLRVPVEDVEIRLGRRELLRRDGQQVVREVQIELLVEVVADPRPVREQVLDRDALVDEREIGAEDRTRRRREAQSSVLDETHDDERRQSLRAARDAELRVGRRSGSHARGRRARTRGRPRCRRAPSTRTTPENPVSAAIRAEVARERAHGATPARCSASRGDRP